jgi:hypothetical protein
MYDYEVPYLSGDGYNRNCFYDTTTQFPQGHVRTDYYQMINSYDECNSALANKNMIAGVLDPYSSAFKYYLSGVLTIAQCPSGYPSHAVAIVGWSGNQVYP